MNAFLTGRHGNALQAASQGGHEKIVQMLLEKGANVNAPGGQCGIGTALQAASQEGHEKIIQILLERGADVNAPPSGVDIGTALQAASQKGHEKIVQMLLERGADVNTPPSSEYGIGTALQTASQGGHKKIVQILLEKGADVNTPGGLGIGTALQAASRGGHEKARTRFCVKRPSVNEYSILFAISNNGRHATSPGYSRGCSAERSGCFGGCQRHVGFSQRQSGMAAGGVPHLPHQGNHAALLV